MHDENRTTDSREASNTIIDRREYMRLTGATAASATGVAGLGSVSAADYETVTVSPGESESWSLGDGDTLENVLIDITAAGAQYSINANGDGWAIRNVGVRGTYDAGDTEPFIVQCPNGGSAVIENVYLGGGGSNGSTGIFVFPDHSGHIDIDNVNVQGWSDNGVYASAPGNHDSHANPGGGGTIAITNSYGADNGISNFRLGTDGSYCENCTSVGGQRGYWGFYHETDVIDCDIDSGIYTSDSNWNDCSVVNVENTRFSGGTTTYTACAQIDGSSAGNPQTSPPDGVPTSAEEAASGSGSGGGGGGGPSEDRLKIVAASDASDVSYTFDVYGTVSKVTDNGDDSAENNDTITDNGDGTYTVDGLTGNGYGDTFDYDGNVFSWSSSHSSSAYALYRNGTQVTADELTKDRFEIVAGDSASEMAYQFTVDGSVSKVTDNGDDSAENNDTITDNGDGTYAVEGVTGNGYGDTFDFDGTRSDWSSDHAESAYTLYTNGSETPPDDIGDGGSGRTVLDDFEDGDVNEYSGNTSTYQVQSSTVLEGSSTLEATSPYGEIARADVTTRRGHEYRCRIQASTGSGSKPSLLACVQNEADPMQDAYWAFPNVSTGEFKLMRRDGGSSTTLDAVSYALQEGDEYEIALELGSDTVKAVLYDASGTIVAETAAVTDGTYSGGTFGLYTGGGTPAYYDAVTETPLDSA